MHVKCYDQKNIYFNFVSDSPRSTTISLSADVNVKVGRPLTFICVTDANPVPVRHSWYRYDDKKQADLKIRDSALNNTLTFREIQRADEACYVCSATNAIGTGEKSKPVCILVHCKYFSKVGKIVHHMFNSCMSLCTAKVKKKILTDDLI